MTRWTGPLAGAALVALGLSSPAHAVSTTFDFTTGGSNIGTGMATFTSGVHSVDVYAINTESPTPPPFVTQNGDGVGVSFDGEVDFGLDPVGEVDNIGYDEALVFDFGNLASFGSTAVTAAFPPCVKFFIKICGADDDWEIYGSNDSSVTTYTSGSLDDFKSLGTLLAYEDDDTVVDLTGIEEQYRYLIATTKTKDAFKGKDGFRIASATVDIIPLPMGLPLVASAFGLAALVRARRARG